MATVEKSKMTIATLGAFGIHMVGKKLGASTTQSFGAAMIFAYGVWNSQALTDFLVAKREQEGQNQNTLPPNAPTRPNANTSISTPIGVATSKPPPSDTEPVRTDGHYTLRGFGTFA